MADRLFNHPRALAEYLVTGDTPGPISVDIDTTNVCQHHCPRCTTETMYEDAQSDKPQGTKWTHELFDKVFAELSGLGTKAIVLTGGGDPTIFPGFDRLVARATKRWGLDVGLKTNGGIIRRKHIDNLHYAKWVRVSLDGATPESYKVTHGVPADEFYRVLDTIRMLSERPRTTTIGVGFLVGNGTEHELTQGAELVRSLGADYIQFRPFDNWTPSARVDAEIAALQQAMNCDDFRVTFPNAGRCGAVPQYDTCHAVAFVPKIAADLNVYACCNRRDDQVLLGNLADDSFTRIWRGKRAKLFRLQIGPGLCMDVCRHHARNKLICDIIDGFKGDHRNFV